VYDCFLSGFAGCIVVFNRRLQRACFWRRRSWNLQKAVFGNMQRCAPNCALHFCVRQVTKKTSDFLVVLHGSLRSRRAVGSLVSRAVGASCGRGRSRAVPKGACITFHNLIPHLCAVLRCILLMHCVHADRLHFSLCLLARLDLCQRQVGGHPISHIHREVLRALDVAGVHPVDCWFMAGLELGGFKRRVQPQRVQVHFILGSITRWQSTRRTASWRA
jgi:hypothetical protein